jgi:dihydrofolate reductase
MRDINLIAQTSLDGFVAGPKGEFDHFTGGEETLEFVCGLTDSADAAMFGRVSYELLEPYWPTAGSKPGATKNVIKYSNWYNSASKIVLSGSLRKDDLKNVTIISDHLLPEITKIKKQNGKDILIFGDGIPLFRTRDHVIRFTLSSSRQLPNGVLCNKYALRNAN